MGLDPRSLSPAIRVDVSTDHSSGVDVFGTPDAFVRNLQREFARNAERYRLMKWAGQAMPGITVHPPGSGIMHTINMERLSQVVVRESRDGIAWIHPDLMIGTDSHTPMINALGILAWGVGGLEAEGALFGVPVTLRIPEVVGVRLTGRPRPGVLATDVALTVTALLRAQDVTGAFVEFFGPGVSALSVGERGAIANMAPEYGASTGYFPIDEATLSYLRLVGRSADHVAAVETYAKENGLWFDPQAEPVYTAVIDLALDTIEPSAAGPRRPQDRFALGTTRDCFEPPLDGAVGAGLTDGAVAIAAITSCTNTSDQRMLLAAGLLARRARKSGLRPPPWVKTSLAPGSPTAENLLRRAGLLEDLEAVGFAIVGYGCTTCIGNSGPLTPAVAEMIGKPGFRPVAVLSGNRNFPGRVHPDLEYGFLCSPPAVIAFALAGTVAIDITADPLGTDGDGAPIRLADLWPSEQDIDAALAAMATADFAQAYGKAALNPLWASLEAPAGDLFPWDPASTYLRRPPFVQASIAAPTTAPSEPLLVLGDDMTTDHISPAGHIRADSEAGHWLVARGANPRDLNVYASRRGNFEVMVRGAFQNRLVRNLLAPEAPPGWTIHAPTGEMVTLTEAAERHARSGTPLAIVAGERYGMGSSRDWAAKAVALLGVRSILAVSFERIHRTNLIGMGILPLLLPPGTTPETLALIPGDRIDVPLGLSGLAPRVAWPVRLLRADGRVEALATVAAVETSLEVTLLRHGGLIPHVLGSFRSHEEAA